MPLKASPEKILLVDDVPANLSVLISALEPEGYEILTAHNGLAALKVAAKALPDLILLDILMPELDGLATCRRLKDDEATRDIPVIFLTSVEDGDFRGKELGAVGYVTKPVRADRLLALVAEHVSGGAHPIG